LTKRAFRRRPINQLMNRDNEQETQHDERLHNFNT
jgi:hypothetical protein